MEKNFRKSPFIRQFFSVCVFIALFVTSGFAQHLTISTTGDQGTSGTNWSISGNTLNVGATGSATIHPNVITNHLSNVGDLTVNLPSQSGVSRNMNINASISYTGGTNRTLTLNCANEMVFANATGITSSSARLNLVLRTALGLPDNGYIQMNGVTIQTNGGHFWAGGGPTTATWNGLTVGNSLARTWSDDIPGIAVVGSSITTNGGNLYFAGLSYNSGDDDGVNWGVNIERSTISSAAGSIEINGQVNGKFTNGSGTYLNGQTGAVSIGTTSGAITINGYGYDDTSTGNSWRHGILSLGTVAIRTVSGNISLRGEANFSSAINDKEGIIFGSGTSVCSQTGNISLSGSNTRESDGQYSNSIRFAAGDITNGIRIGFDGTNAYSGNILIEGNSIYQRLNNAGAGSISMQTTGTLTIQPTGNAFTFMRAGDAGTLTFDDDWNFGTTLGSFTYGKSTNTANLTLASPRTTSGSMSIYAGNIIAQQNLTTTNTNANILLQATGYIEIAASRVLQTNRGNITFRSNSLGTAVVLPNANTGSITLNSGSSLLSNGGNITLGGNFTGTEGAGLYAASNRSGGSPGILINNATLTAAGGNIKIYGKCNSSFNDGVRLQANITTTGTGTIGIYGDAFGGNDGNYYGGITFNSEVSNIETDQGNITLSGNLINTQSNNTFGINFYRSLGATGQTKHIQILSRSGAIQITGDRGTIATGAGGIGYSSWGNIYFGSPSNNSWLATGDIVFTYSSLVGAGLNGFKVKTRGAVTYQPVGTSFDNAQTFPFNSNYTVADSASRLTIGKTGNTANITIGANISVAGPITIFGGNIFQNANITSTTAANIELNGREGFYTSNDPRKSITSAGGNITINADMDANGSGLLDLDYLTINPGAGNIIIRGETFFFNTGSDADKPWINGTGSFTLESNDAAFGQGLLLHWFKLDQDANGMSGLTIGKSTNDQIVTHDHPGGIVVAGPVTIYGLLVGINENLISTATGAKMLFKALGWVWVNVEGKTVQSNNGDIIFWADSDNSQASSSAGNNDEIGLRAGVIVNTQGGKLIMAGGLDDGANGGVASDGIPDNYAYRGAGGYTGGVNLGVAQGTGTVVSLLTGGGDIIIKGRSAWQGQDARPGVTSQSNLLINSGTGRINIQGISSVNHGIEFTYGQLPNIAITSSYAGVGPAITIAGGSTSNLGIVLFNANGGNVLIQSTSASGGGILMEGSSIAAGNGAISLANYNSTTKTQFLSGNGDIILRAAPVGSVTQGLGQIFSYGNIYFGSRLNTTPVQGIIPSVISTNANVLLSGNNVFFDEVITKAGTTGSFKIEPRTADNSFSDATTIRNLDVSTVSAFTSGKVGNTAALTISSALTAAAPMTFHGGAMTIGGALTATNNSINLHASGAVTQTQPIVANNLGLHGTGTFTLNNTSNNIATLAGGESSTRLGSLSFTDASGGLTVGTVGTKSGVHSSGTVLVETLTGDLTIAQNISTTNTTSNAIQINAGKNAAIGIRTGGDIKISGSPAITMGTGGIAKLFSGSEDQSTGLDAFIGNPQNIRNVADETTTTFVPALEANKMYGIYRTSRGRGDLTIVSSGGDAEGSTWVYENGLIITTSSPVNIRDSIIQRKLLLGDVTIEANKVTFSANIINTTANNFKVLSKTHIVNTNATTISSNGGDVLLASNVDNATDFDSTTNGYIRLLFGVTINTNGGDITLGGGNNQGSDFALGSSTDNHTDGVRIDQVANFNSGGGNIAIKGKSYAKSEGGANGASGLGFYFLSSADTISSGTGTILLDGYSQTTGSTYSSGIVFQVYNASFPFTIQSANTSANAITINGYAHGASSETFGIESEESTSLNITATGVGGGVTINAGNNTNNDFYDIVLRGPTNILANGGPISMNGKYNNGKEGGRMFLNQILNLGSKAASVVPSSSSDLNIQFDSYSFNGYRPNIATTGAVDWKSASASFKYGANSDWFTWNQNGQTMRSFTFGKPNNTGNLTIDRAITAAGPINMYGGAITINAALTSSDTGNIFLKSIWNGNPSISNNSTITKSGGTGVLTMQGNARVTNTGTITTSGTGVMDVIMWSDYDNTNNDGGVSQFGTISTNGGHVWLGGSNSNGGSYTWNGLTVGNGPSIGSNGYNGFAMDFYGDITTNGGDVLAWAGNGTSVYYGIATNDDGSNVITGSGDLIFIADQVMGTWQNSIVYTGTGKVYLLPDAGSYGTTLDWTHTSNLDDINIGGIYNFFYIRNSTSLTGLNLGYYDQMSDSSGAVIMTNTSPVTISSPNTIAGPIGIYGGAIALNANFATSDTLTGNMVIKGTSLSGTGNLTLAKNRNANIDVSATSTYNGIISGNQASFTKAGAGLLTLTKDHTYSGATLITRGNLQVGSGGSLSQASSGTINSTSSVTIDSSAKLILAPNEDITFTKSISGVGGLEIKGMSGLYLNGFLTTIPVTIARNTKVLEVLTRITGAKTGGANISGLAGAYVKSYDAVNNSATFQFQVVEGVNGGFTKCVFVKLQQAGNDVTISINTTPYGTGAAYHTSNILGTDMTSNRTTQLLATTSGGTGYGISEVYMSGKVNLTGVLTYQDTTVLSNTVNSSSTSPIYSFTSKGTQEITDTSSSFPGAVVNNGLVIFKRATPLTIAGNMSGSEEILQLGAPITLTGNSTHTGIITIDKDSSLIIGTGGTSGSISANIVNYGRLTFNRSDSSAYPGTLSGSGNLTKSGQGALLMTGVNTYTGPTVINAGNLIFENNIPFTASSSFSGAGKLELRPRSASFTNPVSYPIGGFNISTSIGGLTIGKPGNTANISLTAPVQVAGPVSFYGGDLAIDHNITTNAPGADVLLQGTGDVTLTANDSIRTDGGDIIFWANADGLSGSSDGYISVGSGASIDSRRATDRINLDTTNATGGGHLILAGGVGQLGGYPTGYATSSDTLNPGVRIGTHADSVGVTLLSGGGDMIIRGAGLVSGTGALGGRGVVSYYEGKLNAGRGTIMIDGTSAHNHGIEIGSDGGQDGFNNYFIAGGGNSSTPAIRLKGASQSNDLGYAGIQIGFANKSATERSLFQALGSGGIEVEANRLALNATAFLATSDTIKFTVTNGGTFNPSVFAGSPNYTQTKNYLGACPTADCPGSLVSSSTASIEILADTFVINTNYPVNISTGGALTIAPHSLSFRIPFSLDDDKWNIANGLTGLQLGKSGNAVNMTLPSARTIAGPVSIYGGKININAALTATNSNLNFHALDSVIQTAPITANGLGLHGPGHFSLSHASNNVSTIAGGVDTTRLGSLHYVDMSGGLEIGTVNPTGIYAAGPILIETLNGDIDLKEPVSSNSNIDSLTGYKGAIVLNAGKNISINTPTGGGINVSANGAVSAPNGIVKLFGGNADDSDGLNTLVGGVGRTRLYVDETTTTYSPVLTSKGKFALYRDRSLCFADTASITPIICINTSLPVITHVTGGATGIGTPQGLPVGVTAQWGSNAILISGTPTVAGTFNYTIPLTGPCGSGNPVATGTITVTASNTASAASVSPTLCLNTVLPRIRHNTTGATGIGTVTGLPDGVSAVWDADSIILSGTPTAAGIFNYSIPLTGGCGSINATGTITVISVNTFSPASSTPTLCEGTLLTNITIRTTGATGIGSAAGLPFGITASWTSDTITISGTPTSPGSFNYLIPLTGGCGSVNASGSINISPDNTVSAPSSSPILCANTVLTEITHATTGATGIGTPSGLPAGVTATWSADTIRLTGTPTEAGTFNYSIPLTGGCDSVNAIGSIIVVPENTVSAASSMPSICIQTALTNITHVTTGASGIGTATGLPAGVTAFWASNTITISGTPTQTGTFNYTIPLIGGCGSVNATGKITVTLVNSVSSASLTTEQCVNVLLTPVIHTTIGATGIGSVTGLPAGLNATWANDTITINGTPTASGTFNYNIPLTGGCGNVNATGTITISPENTVSNASSSPTLCIQTVLTNITHVTTGATGIIDTATGLPIGVMAVWANDTIIISGTPTESGTFNYSIHLTGGCGNVKAEGIITVTPKNTVSVASSTPSICVNTKLTNITHVTTGATGIGTATGLPAGVIAEWASNTITISGTPTITGTFNYSIPLTGGCDTVHATGTIKVVLVNTVSAASSTPTLCVNAVLANITHLTSGATGIGSVIGLPAGLMAKWASDTITISGTPTASGTFNYIIPLTGGCDSVNAKGTIIVTPANTVSNASASPTLCVNTILTNITHLSTGATGIGLSTGLPAGVTAKWDADTITISGTPTASGTFNYIIPLTGGCDTLFARGTILVTPVNTVSNASSSPILCVNTILPAISHTTLGATGIGAPTGLPDGVTASWNANTLTINGTPKVTGIFNYIIPLTGGCDTLNARGTITISSDNTVSAASFTPNVCVNTALTNITHTTTGASGIGVATGLPAGVIANWASNTITISGTPSESGIFNYSIPLLGGCGNALAKGTITVKTVPLSSIAITDKSGLLNDDGTICKGETAILIAEGGSSFKWSTGETSSILSVSPDNTTDYSVTVTANDGCTVVANAKIKVNVNPIPTVISTNPDCPMSQTGTATASSGSGWSYLWSNGSNTAAITGLVQGAYKVTVTDEMGCKGTATATLTDLSLPVTIGVSKTDVICQGTSTGSISLNVSGGTTPYSYVWSSNAGGRTSASLSNLPVGTYSVTVTEGSTSKCKVVGTVDIIEPSFGILARINISESSGKLADDGIICQNDEAVLTVDAKTNAGATLSSYLWSDANGSNTNSLKTGAAGIYTVTVTDSKGCKTTATSVLSVTPVNKVSTGSSTPTICVNTSLTNITHTTQDATGIGAATGLPAGVSAIWASNIITISGTPTQTGVFNYSIPLTGGCDGVQATGTITVNLANAVSAASSTPSLCVNTVLTNITHTTTGATGIGTATGLPAGVTATWASNVITISGTPTKEGIFNYSIPLNGGCNNVSARGTITVTLSNTAGIASSSPTVCIQSLITNITHTTTGATGIGTATGLPAGVTATWSNNLITISGTPTGSGIFNYSIPLMGGCGNAVARGTINVKEALAASISVADKSGLTNNDGTICLGESAILTALGGSSFQWQSGELSSMISVSPVVSTDYIVTVTGSDGCIGIATTRLIVNAKPSPTVISTNPDCLLGQTGTAMASSGTGWTYEWSNGSKTAGITGLVQGFYKVTVTDEKGCEGTAATNVTDVSRPITIGVSKTDVICQGTTTGSVSLNPSGGTAPYTYAWSANAGGVTASSLTNLPVGKYNVTVTESGANRCSVVSFVEIEEPEFSIQANILVKENSGQQPDDGIICENDAAILMVNAWVNPGSTNSSYRWNDASNSTSSSLTANAAGTYIVTVTDSRGCFTTVSKTIAVRPSSTVTAASSTPILCVNAVLTNITHTTTGAIGIGTATGLPAGITASWASNIITISGTPTESGSFSYTIPLMGGCGNISATGVITVNPISTVSAASTAPTLCVQTNLTNITHTTTGATGIGTATGLPAGVTATWASNVITISGTPTKDGIFNYIIPLNGVCNNVSARGTITVTLPNSVGIASSSPTVCIQSLITNITHTTTGATGIGTATGLPAGVTATWSNNLITISGTPTGSGIFNYSIPLTGGCGNAVARGTINVKEALAASISVADKSGLTNNDGTICLGESAILTALGGSSFQWQSGELSSMISVSPVVSTDYTVTVTGSDGCIGIATTRLIVNAKPSPTVISTNPDCLLGQTGTAMASSGTGWTYEWSNGSKTAGITGLVQGFYKVTVTDEKGCEGTAATNVTDVSRPITIGVSKTDVICQGTTTGSVSLNPSGGTAPYTYAWSANAGGVTASSLTNLPVGKYNVTVTESGANRCSAVSFVEIEAPEFSIQANILVKENSGQQPDDGIICENDAAILMVNAWVNPGSTNSSYRWNDVSNSTSSSLTANAAGTYIVTVTDSRGCFTTVSKTIAVRPTNTVTAASSTPILCVNTVLTNITHTTTGATGIGTATGLPAGVTATWASNVITISGTPTKDGIFNYSIPLNGGCNNVSARGTITVTLSNTAGIASSSPTVCIQSLITNITHTTTGATGIGTATGLPAGVTASWANNLITISGTPSANGIFNYSIPLTGGCGNAVARGTINVKGVLAASISVADKSGLTNNDGTICLGESAILTALGGSSFQWQSGELSSMISVSPVVSTDYTVTVTGSDGCIGIATTRLIVNAKPSPTVISTNPDCLLGQTGTAMASSGTGWTYEWSNGSKTAGITGLVQGFYKVTVTDEKAAKEQQRRI
jgi:autotransporter-associated beta strand protein